MLTRPSFSAAVAVAATVAAAALPCAPWRLGARPPRVLVWAQRHGDAVPVVVCLGCQSTDSLTPALTPLLASVRTGAQWRLGATSAPLRRIRHAGASSSVACPREALPCASVGRGLSILTVESHDVLGASSTSPYIGTRLTALRRTSQILRFPRHRRRRIHTNQLPINHGLRVRVLSPMSTFPRQDSRISSSTPG